jgi:hypothetical protein
MTKKKWFLLIGAIVTMWCAYTGAHIWHSLNDKTNTNWAPSITSSSLKGNHHLRCLPKSLIQGANSEMGLRSNFIVKAPAHQLEVAIANRQYDRSAPYMQSKSFKSSDYDPSKQNQYAHLIHGSFFVVRQSVTARFKVGSHFKSTIVVTDDSSAAMANMQRKNNPALSP